jgi:thiol-disulfide isomerase/thioredoxin
MGHACPNAIDRLVRTERFDVRSWTIYELVSPAVGDPFRAFSQERDVTMLRRNVIGVVVALATACVATSVRAQTLGIGDPAPKIEVKSFVKGEPVKSFEPGKNYVVEFWATWCGPCKTSIPHLTELQKKHADVSFIGVSVFEQDQSGVEPFVKEMGDKMDYRVAVDAVPADKDPGQGAMAKSWMVASGSDGIPTAFIVNKEGKIAWIGHPMEMEKPLEKVIAGTWDLKTAAEEIRKGKEAQAKGQAELQKFVAKLQSAQQSGQPKKILEAIDEIVAARPELELNLGAMKMQALIKLDQQDKALELAQKLEQSKMGESAEGLNNIAWSILDPDLKVKASPELLKLALRTAKKADEESKSKNGAIADTLGKAYFDSGDAAKAVETQERAIRLLKESGEPVDPSMKDRLEQYKKAAAEKK